MVALWVALGIIALLLLLDIIISNKLCSIMLHPKKNSPEAVLNYSVEGKRFTRDDLDLCSKEYVTLNSRYGYELHGLILNNDISVLPENRTKVVVLCHGYTSAKVSMFGYAKILMRLGFTAVMFDQRNHGDNVDCFTTMGYYEKFDLNTIIDYCYERYGADVRILTYGESMGSATVLNYLAIDDRIACTIADCGYSDLRELCYHQTANVFHLPAPLIMPIASIIFRIRSGIRLSDVSPREGVLKTKTPILFIHGSSDTFVPTHMSQDMYGLGTGRKQLYICEGAVHALSHVTHMEEYERIVTEFVQQNYC